MKVSLGDKTRHLNREILMNCQLVEVTSPFMPLKGIKKDSKEFRSSSCKKKKKKAATTSRLGESKKKIKELKTRRGSLPHSNPSS